jgi:hypothetical protein
MQASTEAITPSTPTPTPTITTPTPLAPPPKNCPRCRGSMLMERDWYGAYGTCICCGYVHEMAARSPMEILREEEELSATRQRRRQPSHGKLRL